MESRGNDDEEFCHEKWKKSGRKKPPILVVIIVFVWKTVGGDKIELKKCKI